MKKRKSYFVLQDWSFNQSYSKRNVHTVTKAKFVLEVQDFANCESNVNFRESLLLGFLYFYKLKKIPWKDYVLI